MLPPYQLELGPDVAYVQRLSASPTQGVGVRSALSPGLFSRAYLLPWFAVGFRYTQSYHILDLSPEGLGTNSPKLEAASEFRVTTLQGSVQPTWVVRPTLRLYSSIGLGWGSVTTPSIRLTGPASSAIRQRRGVFVEVPVGLGVTWWVFPRWISLTYESIFAPAMFSSGDAYSPDSYISPSGQNAIATPMPTFRGNAYHHFAIALTI